MTLHKRLRFIGLCSILIAIPLLFSTKIPTVSARDGRAPVSSSEKDAVKKTLEAYWKKWGEKWCEGGWSGCGIVPMHEFNGLLASLNAARNQAQLDWVRFMTLKKDECLMQYIGDRYAGELKNCLGEALRSIPWPGTVEAADLFPERCPWCHKSPCGRRCWRKRGHWGKHNDGMHRFATKEAYYCSTGGEPPKRVSKATRFTSPSIDGYRLDWCLTWGSNCGKPAADAFCSSKGFSESISHSGPDMGPTQTKIIGSGQICRGEGCGSFHYIDCVK